MNPYYTFKRDWVIYECPMGGFRYETEVNVWTAKSDKPTHNFHGTEEEAGDYCRNLDNVAEVQES